MTPDELRALVEAATQRGEKWSLDYAELASLAPELALQLANAMEALEQGYLLPIQRQNHHGGQMTPGMTYCLEPEVVGGLLADFQALGATHNKKEGGSSYDA